jgi:hypothetical protein
MSSVCAYISIQHKQTDIDEAALPAEVWMTSQSEVPVRECSLCWDQIIDGKNPASVSLFPHQRHGVTFVRFCHEDMPPDKRYIRIASETGIEDQAGQKSRIHLKWKTYLTLVKIVSADSQPKCWLVSINPDEKRSPIEVKREVPISRYEWYLEHNDSPWDEC